MLQKNKTLKSLLALFLVLVLGFTLTMPSGALAASTTKLTAQPNASSGNGVIGGVTTRITWEGQPDEGEVITQLRLTFPEDAEFETERGTATLLTGPEQLDRVDLGATFTRDGQTIVADFANAQEAAGGYIRMQVFGVEFPRSGGVMQFTGEYTLADGTVTSLGIMPEINVESSTWAQVASNWLADQSWVRAWNSVTFLNLFLNPVIAIRALPSVFGGFLMALAVVALAFPCAIPIGLLLALMRMSNKRVLRGIASLYVNVIRGTPLFLQIYIMFFGLPLAGVNMPMYVMSVMVLSLNSGAYLCEIFRAGIQSIPKGQFEASRSLGMNGAQTMAFVIIPQTVRRVIPTMTSEFILLYKDTSLLASVGFMEIIMYAKSIVATTGSISPYIVAALFYLVITLPLAKVVGVLEARLAGNDTGTSVKKMTREEKKAAKAREKERAAKAKAKSKGKAKGKANAKKARKDAVVPVGYGETDDSKDGDEDGFDRFGGKAITSVEINSL